jgi:hypothetical protein
VPLDKRRVAAEFASTSEHALADVASGDDDTRPIAEGVVRSTTIEPPVLAASGAGAIRWGAWAGGVCVAGGVAVLGWIAFSHLERHPAGNLKPADGAVVSKRFEPVKRPLAGARVDDAIDSSKDVRRGVDVKPAVVAIEAPVPQPVAVDTPIVRSEKPAKERAATNHRAARNVTQHPAPRVTAPVSAHNKTPAPSSAGDYSPFAPTQLGVDEYTSVTLSAAPRLRDNATSPRVHSLEPGEMEWMTKRSQRRVTDMPDQFSN